MPSNFDALPLADRYAILKAEADALAKQIDALKAEIKASGLEFVEGDSVTIDKHTGHLTKMTSRYVVVRSLVARGEPERWLITSFRAQTVNRCRLVEPAIATSWLCVEPPEGTAALMADRGHRAVHPHHSTIDEAFVGRDFAKARRIQQQHRLRRILPHGRAVEDLHLLRILGRAASEPLVDFLELFGFLDESFDFLLGKSTLVIGDGNLVVLSSGLLDGIDIEDTVDI